MRSTFNSPSSSSGDEFFHWGVTNMPLEWGTPNSILPCSFPRADLHALGAASPGAACCCVQQGDSLGYGAKCGQKHRGTHGCPCWALWGQRAIWLTLHSHWEGLLCVLLDNGKQAAGDCCKLAQRSVYLKSARSKSTFKQWRGARKMCLGDVGGGGEEERKGLCGHRGVWGRGVRSLSCWSDGTVM